MQKLNRRERILLICCVVIVAAAAWLQLHPRHAAGARKLLATEAARSKKDIALRAYRRMGGEQHEMEARLAADTAALPEENLVPRLARDLQEEASRDSIHLSEIKPVRSRPLVTGEADAVSVEVRFNAPFQPHTVRFLYNLEDPKKQMVVDRLKVTSGEGSGGRVDVTARVTVISRARRPRPDLKGSGNDKTGI